MPEDWRTQETRPHFMEDAGNRTTIPQNPHNIHRRSHPRNLLSFWLTAILRDEWIPTVSVMMVISKPNKYLAHYRHIGPPLSISQINKENLHSHGWRRQWSLPFQYLFLCFFLLFPFQLRSEIPRSLPVKYQQRRQYDTALQLQSRPHRLWMCDQAICAQRAQATI